MYALVRGAAIRAPATRRLRRRSRCLFGAGHPYGERVVRRARRHHQGRPRPRPPGRGPLADRIERSSTARASVSFELPLDGSRAINVGGTRRMLEFAEPLPGLGAGCGASPTLHGLRRGRARRHLQRGRPRRRPAFPQPLRALEVRGRGLVKGWRSRMPVTVVRPSIVVGERDSGWTPKFNVIYWPLRAFSRGAYSVARRALARPWTSFRSTTSPTPPSPSAGLPTPWASTFHLSAGSAASAASATHRAGDAVVRRAAPRLLEPSSTGGWSIR